MPRDSNTMPICSPSKHECVEKAVGIVEQTAFDVTGRIWLNYLNQSGASELGTHGPMGPRGLWYLNCIDYRTRAIRTRGLYTFYPLFEVHLCTLKSLISMEFFLFFLRQFSQLQANFHLLLCF